MYKPVKPISIGFCLLSVLVIVCAGVLPATASVPGLSISPATIQNDYTGKIILNISGLTSGKTVIVDKFADFNGNGIVDAGDFCVQSFRVTDGQLPSIGGVRNINVPGDEDGLVNGQIRAEAPYPGLDATLDQIAGNYLFRVTDPAESFSPLLQSFIVTQKIYPQGITGKITSSQSGLPLAYAFVILLDQNGMGLGYATFANAAGDFTLYCTPGAYSILAVKSGFVSNFSNSAVTVTANNFITSNAALPVANRTITGKVSETPSGMGISGVLVQGNPDTDHFVLTFTDSAGNFTLPVTAGQCKINLGNSIAHQGYLLSEWDLGPVVDTTISNVTIPDIQLAKATALIFGKVTDNLGAPVLDIGVYAYDNYHEGSGKSFSLDGSYAIGVVAGSWSVGASEDDLSSRGYIGQYTNVSLTAGQALKVDIYLGHVTAQISVHVRGKDGVDLANINLYAYATLNGKQYSANGTTGGSGSCQLQVIDGVWHVGVNGDNLIAQGYNPVSEQIVTISGANGSLEFIADPIAPVVTDDGLYTASTSQLHAQWSSGAKGGIKECQYAIGIYSWDPGSGYLVDWTSTGTSTNVTSGSLPLGVGQTYYFYVKIKDNAGLWSAVGVSNGIMVVSKICASPGIAKLAADNTLIGMSAIVTANFASTSDFIYVQSIDRSSGIQVNFNNSPPPPPPFYPNIASSIASSDIIALAGTMSTNSNGERIITNVRNEITGSTGSPRPLAMSNKSLGGGDWHYSQSSSVGQMGVTGGSGLNNIGLLVKTWGKVKEFDPAAIPRWFVINDGSGAEVRCEVPSGVVLNTTWIDVVVTGISRLYKDGAEYKRRLLVRDASDILVIK